MTASHSILLSLLRSAIGSKPVDCDLTAISSEEWNKIIDLSFDQGVDAISVNGYNASLGNGVCLLESDELEDLRLDWFGSVLQAEADYTKFIRTISSIAKLFAENGIRMMLMKGYGLSLDWPVPEHRPTGDIDIFLFGDKERADRLVEETLGVKVEREYHKHSHFVFHNVTIENHGKFIDDVNHKSNVRFEEILDAQLQAEKDGLMESGIANCLLPPSTWNAMFLLRHAGEHFAGGGISLRQVLDLGFFFMRHCDEVDWEVVLRVFEEERMKVFYDAVATICVRDLGMMEECFKGFERNDVLADRVLEDVFAEKKRLPMTTAGIKGLAKVKYGVQKSLRWWRNRWKYRMVYDETMWESFWGLAVNRVKQTSIRKE